MTIYGILPMSGKGTRIQPIGFSKELYPVVYKQKHFTISEFSVRGMLQAGAQEIKMIINPEKMDIAKYYSRTNYPTSVYFYDSPSLPESCLYPIDLLKDDDICLFGLPDTLFAPISSYKEILKSIVGGADIALGLFQVSDGSKYDSVLLDKYNRVLKIVVKQNPPLSNWIWGIWGGKVSTLKFLKKLVRKQQSKGEKLLGVALNELCMNSEVKVTGVKLSNKYFDVGTMDAVVQANQVIKNFNI